jgi:hypothetical protein
MQDASPQRRPGPLRVEPGRPLQQLVQAGEAGRPVDEVGDMPSSPCLDPRQHVDQDDLADQFRRFGGQRDGGEAAERHADHSRGGGGELADDSRVAVRVQPLLGAAPGQVTGWAAVSVTALNSANRDALSWLRDWCPVAVLDGTILVYRFNRPPGARPAQPLPASPAPLCSGPWSSPRS